MANPDTKPNSNSDLSAVFQAQHTAFLRNGPPSYEQRKATLKRLLAAVQNQEREIVAALQADLRKPETETLISEILTVSEALRHTISNLNGYMKSKPASPSLMMAGTKAWVHREPMGVVLIISPWNYPFNLCMIPLVSALAAGNRVIVKPSELAPSTSTLVKKMVDELFQADEVAVIEGGVDVSTQLLKQPFDHIFFTGSPGVGKIVMEAAAKNLTSVTLELGGKSPMIIDATADLELSARKLVWGKCFNAGQTCIAPDYVLVEASVHDRFVELVKKELNVRITTSEDYASIVNTFHHRRLQGLIDDAVSRGATAYSHQVDGSPTHLNPTLLTGVTPQMAVMTQEIFGPIIPILSWTDEGSMIAHIRALPDPLALYVFSKDRAFTDRVIARTSAGATCINEVMAHFSHPNLPFGGVNGSGIGKSHGEYGFVAFSNERAILKPRFGVDGFKVLLPPYGKGIAKAIRAVIAKKF